MEIKTTLQIYAHYELTTNIDETDKQWVSVESLNKYFGYDVISEYKSQMNKIVKEK